MLWRRSISPRGEVYKRYRMGPRTEPWGTPHERECLSYSDTSIWTNWERSVKYDVNQSSALPLIPKMKWNLLRECFLQVFYITIWAPDLRLGEVNIMWILVLITAIELFLSLSLWSLAIDQERESLLFWNMLSNEVVLSWLIISLLLHWFQEFLLYNK